MLIRVDQMELLSLKTSLELLDTIFGETELRRDFLRKVDDGLFLFENVDLSDEVMCDLDFVVG